VNLLIGAATIGLILALLGLGIFVSYRIYHAVDLTADGSFGLGAAVAAALLVGGIHPIPASAISALAGAAAGAITGVMHTRMRVHLLLAGVLTTTALYSICLFVMGSGNLNLASAETLISSAEHLGTVLGLPPTVTLLGDAVSASSITTLLLMLLLAAGIGLLLTVFLGTDLGLAMRAAGTNPQMAKAVAIDVDRMVVLGLGLSNGLIALAGGLFAQYQGFANIQMGIGSVVTGLATLMLGETLAGKRPMGRWIAGAIIGAVVFRLLVAAAVRAGLNPDALKLVTAALVLAALVLPQLLERVGRARAELGARSRG
jgi:putative tryptophan/tyrosine transport system permease protein